MKTYHVCYEGTLACSGCNPCSHCLDVVNREVLAQAMRRTTEAIVQARGSKGVVAVEELDTRNFWAVFYGFYGTAWRDLHAAMMNDPKVAERAYDLRAIPGFESTGRYVPPVVAAPLSPIMPASAPSSPAVMPLSALAAQASQAPVPYMPPSEAKEIADRIGLKLPTGPWVSPFTVRDAPAPPVTETESSLAGAPVDVEMQPKLVVGPADIRRVITADDIAASATVLDAAAATPSANGLAATSHD